ncbi:DUF3089 domain-containing protein [Asticcacaulis machinosus]|uniref:DUF3089 domain-containing protein n=1 Tax=Asticcacaulis machinosus TaxID=2984211 RepID=A0ABT5HGW3_9CAUL|nr:DUF3089 domain-containing protein [Asticcacaulis machinosus]MDC7674844.1 DUF3089 domain-containing protein [Asticcacaulis machinosus]
MAKPVFLKHNLGVISLISVAGVLALALILFSDDIKRHNMDPKVPFQTYQRPPAPDYAKPSSWYLNPSLSRTASTRKADVFFVHATSYSVGKEWLGPIDDQAASDDILQMQLPNYAAPFATEGNVYAPRYRQAGLYSMLTRREDAREARQFAYGDVEKAFEAFLRQRRGDRGLVLAGVEQGGLIVDRLLKTKILPDKNLSSQLIAVYIFEAIVPASDYQNGEVKACGSRSQTGCVLAYMSVDAGRPDQALQAERKALIWSENFNLVPLGKEKALCVNPLTGDTSESDVDARQSLGAVNATGLEWDTPPALVPRKVSAQCRGGMLYITRPNSPTFEDDGTWISRMKVNSYNLFYGDIKTDFRDRLYSFPYNQKAQKFQTVTD